MLYGYQMPPLTGGRGRVFSAQAIVTTPVIWSTAAGVGLLLYNGSNAVAGSRGVTAFLLGMSVIETTATTVSGAIGITGGPTTAPTSTTAITSSQCLDFEGSANAAPLCNVYNAGTVSAAGVGFMPAFQVGTNAVTAEICDDNFVHLGGAIKVGVGNFAAVAASATLSSGVYNLGLVWLEVPN
jgi:hypothetical protein